MKKQIKQNRRLVSMCSSGCLLLVLVIHRIAGIWLGASVELLTRLSPIASTTAAFLGDGLDMVRTMVEATMSFLGELLLSFGVATRAPWWRALLLLIHCAVHAGVRDPYESDYVSVVTIHRSRAPDVVMSKILILKSLMRSEEQSV